MDYDPVAVFDKAIKDMPKRVFWEGTPFILNEHTYISRTSGRHSDYTTEVKLCLHGLCIIEISNPKMEPSELLHTSMDVHSLSLMWKTTWNKYDEKD